METPEAWRPRVGEVVQIRGNGTGVVCRVEDKATTWIAHIETDGEAPRQYASYHLLRIERADRSASTDHPVGAARLGRV